MNRVFIIAFLVAVTHLCYSQVYTEKQTRHRFAQLNLGLDLQSSFGGSATYLNAQGNMQSLNLTNSYSPRFIIGGTHFWGHADFYIAIPLNYSKLDEMKNAVVAVATVSIFNEV